MYNCVSSLAQLETIFPKYSQIRNKVCSRVLLTIAYTTYYRVLSTSLALSSRNSVSALDSFPVNDLEILGARIIVLFQQSLALSSRDTVSALDSFPVNELEILGEHGSMYF